MPTYPVDIQVVIGRRECLRRPDQAFRSLPQFAPLLHTLVTGASKRIARTDGAAVSQIRLREFQVRRILSLFLRSSCGEF